MYLRPNPTSKGHLSTQIFLNISQIQAGVYSNHVVSRHARGFN